MQRVAETSRHVRAAQTDSRARRFSPGTGDAAEQAVTKPCLLIHVRRGISGRHSPGDIGPGIHSGEVLRELPSTIPASVHGDAPGHVCVVPFAPTERTRLLQFLHVLPVRGSGEYRLEPGDHPGSSIERSHLEPPHRRAGYSLCSRVKFRTWANSKRLISDRWVVLRLTGLGATPICSSGRFVRSGVFGRSSFGGDERETGSSRPYPESVSVWGSSGGCIVHLGSNESSTRSYLTRRPSGWPCCEYLELRYGDGRLDLTLETG